VTAGLLVSLSQAVDTQSGNPSISGTNGTLQHGSSLTISGSNFGSKPTGAPWKWDSMDGANGERLEPRGWLVHQNNPQPVLSTRRVRPGTTGNAAVLLTQTGGDVPLFGFGNNDGGYLSLTGASAANYRPFPTPAWIDYWMYFHPPSGSNNYKFFRHHANNGSGIPNGFWGMPGTGGVIGCDGFTWSSMSSISYSTGGPNQVLTCPDIRDKWVHVQLAFRTSSTSTGQFIMYVDGIRRFNVTDFGFESGGSQRANFMIESQQLTTSGDGEMYIDDFFIENSYARVEIGDAPNYVDSRHRETQIPTSWANGSVSITLNRGSFPNFSNLYLYVINANGVASPGYSLSGGTGGGSSSMPNAPYNLRIVP
jgi:hypothetical protein